MTQVSEIKMYGIKQYFQTDEGTSLFEGHIYAASESEAEQLALQMNAELGGKMIERQCFQCGHAEIFNNSDLADEHLDVWDDEIY